MTRVSMLRRLPPTWTIRALLVATALVVCLAPLAAQDPTAKVLTQVGMVSIMDGGYLKPLSVGQSIRTRQLIVTGPDSYAQFQISDGSTFEVFSNSKVVFRETPGDWQHLLNVFIGRVKVFIQHLPGVPNPNKVTSPTAVISVRGTVFDVVVEDDDGTTFITVDDGIVDVRNLTAAGNISTLRQGDSIRVVRNQPLAARQIDKGNIMRGVLEKVREAMIVLQQQQRAGIPGGRPGPTSAPVPGGAQGDQGKDDKTGTTSGPTNPPSAPSNPPGPPGGG